MPTKSFFYLDTRRTWHQVNISNEKLLGSGGAGHVYALSDDKVVKRYLPAFLTDKKREELRDKITIMAFKHRQLAALKEQPLAWPLGPLIETEHDLAWLRAQPKPQLDSSEFCGFVMQRVRDFNGLEDVISQHTLGARSIVGADRVRISRRIAESVQLCHDATFVIGDINTRNIVVSSDTLLPTIIDCDSFQYGKYAPDLGTVDFASPRLLRRVEANNNKFEGLLRDVNDDCHALAVLFFMMFMNARHPFDCANAPPLVSARSSAIIARDFPYAAQSKSQPPTSAEANRYGLLPDAIKALFEKQLFRGEPVIAQAWIEPLNQFAGSAGAETVMPPVREPQRVQLQSAKVSAKVIIGIVVAAAIVILLIALAVNSR
jgi:DNA-binding helix-hairpin-helix protein with protein kinase domain